MVTGTHFGWAPTFPLVLPAFLLVRLAAGLDALRLSRPTHLPPVRTGLAARLGLLVGLALIAHHERTNLIEAFRIPSAAMYPTLEVGDHIFVEKLDRDFGPGDVVVFRYPPDPEVMYVKRIVAFGGDRVELREGVLVVNDSPAPTTRTTQGCADAPEAGECSIWEEVLGGHRYRIARTHPENGASFGPFVVPFGQVFVLGDNRDNSSDSRIWGGVKEEQLVGKLKTIWLSTGPNGIRWSRFNLQIGR
jgi:signal peptidase I